MINAFRALRLGTGHGSVSGVSPSSREPRVGSPERDLACSSDAPARTGSAGSLESDDQRGAQNELLGSERWGFMFPLLVLLFLFPPNLYVHIGI